MKPPKKLTYNAFFVKIFSEKTEWGPGAGGVWHGGFLFGFE